MLFETSAWRSLLTAAFLFISSLVFAQQKTVTGRVTDSGNKPVAGASVSIKGTNTGTTTNEDGRYSISVPDNQSVLVISYVGFANQELPVSNRSIIDASLSAANSSLDEIIVTGYTTQRKRDISAAVTVVNVADLKVQPAIDASSQLQGRASGVTVTQNGIPGAGAMVRVRGLGSFQNNNPLYVIDGVQTNSLAALTPNDIESMQVLKDAASAGIYGVRGSNGVIVVTTKKGRKGVLNVNYDMYYGVQDPGKGFDLLNAQEEAELQFLSRRHSGLATTGSVYGDGPSPVLPDYMFYSGAANNGVAIMEGNPGVNPALYDLDYDRLGDPGYAPYIIVPVNKRGTNWFKEATKSAPITNHSVSISNGNENGRFNLSLNYFDQKAITIYQFYKRYTARLNSEFNIFNRIRVGENLQVFSSESNIPGRTTLPNANDGEPNANGTEASIIAQTSRTTSIAPVYTINGTDFAGTAGGNGFGTWGNGKNPVAQLYRERNNRRNDVNVFGNVYAELDLLRHITVRSSFGGSINTRNRIEYPFIEYEHVENNVNTTYNERFVRNYNWIWTNMATYTNSFGDHNITAFAGVESQKSGGRQIIGASTTFFTYNNLNFLNLSNGAVQNLSGSSIYTPVNTVSYFAKADYEFKGKYLASALIRRDGSSRFLNDNIYANFPAFSLGWRISDENFMDDIAWLNDLKIRGSWGKSGNEAAVDAANGYTRFASNRQSSWYDMNGAQNAPLEGFYLSFRGNQAGTWETNTTTNIGFDATIFNNSTEIVFDWYRKKTDGLLFDPPQPGIEGAAPVGFQNVASMENHGIDLLITNRANLSPKFKLTSTLTFTTYKNKITSIADGIEFFDFNSNANEANRIGSAATRNLVGNPLNTYFGYQVLGLFQTQAEADASGQRGAGPGRFRYADINGDRIIDPNDRTIIGNNNPDFTYGLNLSAEYANFDLTAFFYGVQGRDNFNFTRWYTDFSGGFPGGRSKRALYESWLPDGSRPNATVPIQEASVVEAGFSSSGVVSSYFVEDASYLRLRNLQLGYTLPVPLLQKARVSRARIYVQATNLFTITDYTGLDPDITTTDDRASGIDIGAYPTVRQFLVGLNINFQ